MEKLITSICHFVQQLNEQRNLGKIPSVSFQLEKTYVLLEVHTDTPIDLKEVEGRIREEASHKNSINGLSVGTNRWHVLTMHV